jgi:AraC family transcriptional regulator
MIDATGPILHLDAPPRIAGIGVGLHGTKRLQERWLLPDLYSLHIYSYDGELVVDGTTLELHPGVVSIVPPGARMEYTFSGPSEHLYVHFGLQHTGEGRPIPFVTDLGVHAATLADRVRSAAVMTHEAQQSAEIWAVLWRLAAFTDDARPDESGTTAAVREAVRYIEEHLSGDLTVSAIAHAVRFSASHLDRLFTASLGVTVAAFVTERRMATARHLLVDTSQPISSIASSVGIPDLHAFNKACRRWLGAPPRVVRFGRR